MKKNNLNKQILEIIDSFIERNGYQSREFADSDDLLNSGILDSIDVLNIVCEVEKSLSIKVNLDQSSQVINREWFFILN